MRRVLASVPLALLLTLAVPPRAAAYDTLDDVLCACADDALGTGDFVACVAHLTRRLVAKGALDAAARQEAISGASRVDVAALDASCSGGGGGSEPTGWGISLHVGSPFYPAFTPSGPVGAAEGELRIWNFSPADVVLGTRQAGPAEGCLFELVIRDAFGRVVHRQDVACLDALGRVEMPRGTVRSFPFLIPVAYLDSDTSGRDGEALLAGVYALEARLLAEGPDHPFAPDAFEGGYPLARVIIRAG
jgi:hypothetical protein